MKREANTITPETLRSLQRVGAWAYKIPDAPTSKITGMRFTLSKPCDIIAMYGGKMLAIETKLIKGKLRAFSKNDLQKSQIVHLTNITRKGGLAYIFIGVIIPREPSRLYILDWAKWGARILKESIKAKEFLPMDYHVGYERDGKIEYDLSEWIGIETL